MTSAGIPAAAVLHKTQTVRSPAWRRLVNSDSNQRNEYRRPTCEKSKYIQFSLLDMFLVHVNWNQTDNNTWRFQI